MLVRSLSAAVLCAIEPASAVEVGFLGGSYEVAVTLELPHLESNSARSTRTICLPDAAPGEGLVIPVLSDNNPLATCAAGTVVRFGATLAYDIACEGKNAASARAEYTLAAESFTGRIDMKMGGKNMTMTEYQSGRRVGACAEVQ